MNPSAPSSKKVEVFALDLLRLIRAAGREPLERDTLYRPVARTDTTFTVLV